MDPKETETIVSVSEVVKAGYKVEWKEKEDLVVSKGEVVLPTEIRNGTPILPNEICLELIEQIERAKKMQTKMVRIEDEFRIESVWPQLKNAINWLLKNQSI